jgi:hypothetical protein
VSGVDIGLLSIIVIVAVIGVGWLVFEMLSDEEK